MLCGSSSQGHMNAERWCAAYVERVRLASRGQRRVVRALQRPGALGLHRVEARRALASAPSATRLAEAWMHALASAPPPTWTTSRSSGGASGDDLLAERLAAFDGETVQVALARERQRAGARAPRSRRRYGRVAGDARSRGQTVTRAPSSSRRSSTTDRRRPGRRPAACARRPPRRPRPRAPRCRSSRSRARAVGAGRRGRAARATSS